MIAVSHCHLSCAHLLLPFSRSEGYSSTYSALFIAGLALDNTACQGFSLFASLSRSFFEPFLLLSADVLACRILSFCWWSHYIFMAGWNRENYYQCCWLAGSLYCFLAPKSWISCEHQTAGCHIGYGKKRNWERRSSYIVITIRQWSSTRITFYLPASFSFLLIIIVRLGSGRFFALCHSSSHGLACCWVHMGISRNGNRIKFTFRMIDLLPVPLSWSLLSPLSSCAFVSLSLCFSLCSL